jgi:hypothetical protein
MLLKMYKLWTQVLHLVICLACCSVFAGVCFSTRRNPQNQPKNQRQRWYLVSFSPVYNSFGHQAITIFNKCLNQMPPNTIYSPWQASDNTHKMTRQTERWQKCSFLKTETKSKYFQREFHINYLNIYKVG